jgi:hypothetical protein
MTVGTYHMQGDSWPKFVKWLAASFNNHALFEVQYAKFKLVSQNPGESVDAYNVRWNLERDLVDELAVGIRPVVYMRRNLRACIFAALLVPSVPDYLTCARSGEP